MLDFCRTVAPPGSRTSNSIAWARPATACAASAGSSAPVACRAHSGTDSAASMLANK
jgi:hypothetical protein